MGVVVVVVDDGGSWDDGWEMVAETTAESGGRDREADVDSVAVAVVEVLPAVGGRLTSRCGGTEKLKVVLLEEMGRKDCCCWW